jgi:hypothetical protein
VSFEINQQQNKRHFKTNVWIKVGFTKAILEIAKKTFSYGSLFFTLKGIQLMINIT